MYKIVPVYFVTVYGHTQKTASTASSAEDGSARSFRPQPTVVLRHHRQRTQSSSKPKIKNTIK